MGAVSSKIGISRSDSIVVMPRKKRAREWICPFFARQSRRYTKPTELWPRWPDIYRYVEMVMIYTIRDLSDPEDISAAFSAIITVMGRAMLGGVFHGLPELFLGSMLLWEPSRTYTPRRSDLKGAISRRFPSWSWTGWAGPISMSVPLLLFRPRSKEQYDSTFTHHVDFYKVPLVAGSRSREIIRESHSYQLHSNQEQQLGELALKDELLVEHPVDVLLHTESLYSTVIECRAQTAQFSAETFSIDYGGRIDIRDPLGFIVGAMHQVTGPVKVPGRPIELMRISAMDLRPQGAAESPDQTLWALLHQGCPRHCRRNISVCALKYHWNLKLYNVLWIEWKNGIAYRKSVGTILRDAWDAATPEELDIRLG
jgi:hypothetical protein